MKVARVIGTGAGMGYQDAGRRGWSRFGVPPGGAMDPGGWRLANHLVGNVGGQGAACAVEVALQGAEIELLMDCWLGLAGAGHGFARLFRAGEHLRLATDGQCVWRYLAVPGGWEADCDFGSCSRHSVASLGRAIRKGTVLNSVGDNLVPFGHDVARRFCDWDEGPGKAGVFRVYPGPQFASFPEESTRWITEREWLVSSQSDRTGYRLEGEGLPEAAAITSEPVIPGSIQVPPGGQPIVTMPDGPTVGGYPKIAWMEEAERARLAQCPPGTTVRFGWIGCETSDW